jgi:hypothetical protein
MKIKSYDNDGALEKVIVMTSNSSFTIRNKPGFTDFYTVYIGGKDLFAKHRGLRERDRCEELIEVLIDSFNNGETEFRLE